MSQSLELLLAIVVNVVSGLLLYDIDKWRMAKTNSIVSLQHPLIF